MSLTKTAGLNPNPSVPHIANQNKFSKLFLGREFWGPQYPQYVECCVLPSVQHLFTPPLSSTNHKKFSIFAGIARPLGFSPWQDSTKDTVFVVGSTDIKLQNKNLSRYSSAWGTSSLEQKLSRTILFTNCQCLPAKVGKLEMRQLSFICWQMIANRRTYHVTVSELVSWCYNKLQLTAHYFCQNN